MHAFQGTRYTVAGEVGHAGGNHHPSICPYGLFTCADGMIQLSCGSEGLWQKLAAGFGLDPFAPGFATNRERVGNRDAVIELLNATFADIPHAELMARLAEIGIPAGEVRTLDRVYDWDQTRSQGLVIDVDHPLLGTIEIPGPPIRFDDNAFAGGRSEHLHPPLLGEHNDSVRAWLDELDGRPSGTRPTPRRRRRAGRAGRDGRVVTERPHRPGARELLTTVLDAGTFVSWDAAPLAVAEPGSPYAAELEAAALRAGTDEAIVTGEGRIHGHRVAVVVSEFALPRRLDRAGRGRADRPWPSSGPPGSGCRCSRPRPPAEPGCRRAPRRS